MEKRGEEEEEEVEEQKVIPPPKIKVMRPLAPKEITSLDELSAEKDINSIIEMPAKIFTTAFPYGTSGSFVNSITLDAANDPYSLIVRKQLFDLLDIVKATQEGKVEQFIKYDTKTRNGPSVLLSGRRGTGKSILLNQIVEYCRSHGWFVIYIPSVRKFIATGGWVDEQDYVPEQIDVWGRSVIDFFKQLLLMNEDFLKNNKLKNGPYKFTQLTEDEELEIPPANSFLELISTGLKEKNASSEAAYYLVNELKQITGVPILVAMDGIEQLYDKTVFELIDERKILYPKDLVFYRNFLDIVAKGIKSGLVITASSRSHPFTRSIKLEDMPKDMHNIEVPGLSSEETKALVRYYHHLGLVDKANNTKQFAEYVRLVCAGRGKEIFSICALEGSGFVGDDMDMDKKIKSYETRLQGDTNEEEAYME